MKTTPKLFLTLVENHLLPLSMLQILCLFLAPSEIKTKPNQPTKLHYFFFYNQWMRLTKMVYILYLKLNTV